MMECCSKTSFSEFNSGSTGSSPRGGADSKVSKSDGVLLQSFLEHDPLKPRNPRNPRRWCHDPLLGTSPTRAGGQDGVSSQANSFKLDANPMESSERVLANMGWS